MRRFAIYLKGNYFQLEQSKYGIEVKDFSEIQLGTEIEILFVHKIPLRLNIGATQTTFLPRQSNNWAFKNKWKLVKETDSETESETESVYKLDSVEEAK